MRECAPEIAHAYKFSLTHKHMHNHIIFIHVQTNGSNAITANALALTHASAIKPTTKNDVVEC